MGRNTIVNVREKIEYLNDMDSVSQPLSFEAWGVGQTKYHLSNENTGARIGPICTGASEFLVFLNGFENGARQ